MVLYKNYILVFALSVIVSCAFGQSNYNKVKVNKMKFDIKVGESFKIQRVSNPTTGYEWVWSNKEEITIVTSKGSKYKSDPNPNKLNGVGGTETWKFTGKKKGHQIIELKYCRPWSSDSTVEILKINVKVK